MHVITTREFNYDLTDQEIVDLVLGIVEDFTAMGVMKDIKVEVTVNEPYEDEYYKEEGYALLTIWINSNLGPESFGSRFATDHVICDRAGDEDEEVLILVQRGQVLEQMLKAALPDITIQTKFPDIAGVGKDGGDSG